MCIVGFVTSLLYDYGQNTWASKIKYVWNILKNSEYYVSENLKLLIKQVS